MYFMDKEEELIGKEIAFTQMAQFAEAITIVTKDKGILVVQQCINEEDGESTTYVYPKRKANAYIAKNAYLKQKLHEIGIITNEDIEAYEEAERQKFEKEREERRVLKEKKEKEAYERLKAKYEE